MKIGAQGLSAGRKLSWHHGCVIDGSVAVVGRLHGEQALTGLVGVLASVQGPGEPPGLEQTVTPTHHTTEPDPKLGEIIEQEFLRSGELKWSLSSPVPFLSALSNPSRDHLYFLYKNKQHLLVTSF